MLPLSPFIHGLVLSGGLIMAFGTQNVFVFLQGAIQPSLFQAIPVALTASLSDTFLILISVLGISVVVLTIPWLKLLLIISGTIFVVYIGWTIWHGSDQTTKDFQETINWSLKKKIVFTLSISLLNPHAILDTVGIIGTSSLSYNGLDKITFALACILVSWSFFFSLLFVGRKTKKLGLNPKIINRISAFIIWISAFYLASYFI